MDDTFLDSTLPPTPCHKLFFDYCHLLQKSKLLLRELIFDTITTILLGVFTFGVDRGCSNDIKATAIWLFVTYLLNILALLIARYALRQNLKSDGKWFLCIVACWSYMAIFLTFWLMLLVIEGFFYGWRYKGGESCGGLFCVVYYYGVAMLVENVYSRVVLIMVKRDANVAVNLNNA